MRRRGRRLPYLCWRGRMGRRRRRSDPPGPPPPGSAALAAPNLKKRGGGTRTWICVEAAKASVQTLEVDKATMMQRCELPARDLHLLDPLFVYPSTILGRKRAIVVNLEQIRCFITVDEVLLLNSLDSYVLQYAAELQRLLLQPIEGDELALTAPLRHKRLSAAPQEVRSEALAAAAAVGLPWKLFGSLLPKEKIAA